MKRKVLSILDWVLLGVVALSVLVFILYPFVAVFWTSLVENGTVTLSGFQWIRTDWKLITNSLTVGILTTLLSTLFSIFISTDYFMQTKTGRRIILSVLMLTIISPPFVTSLSYIQLFGRRGFLTHGLLGLSVNPYGLLGIVLMESLGFTSLNSLLLIGFLDQLDPAALDSARSLGASSSHVLWDIVFPLMKPALKVVMLLTFIRSLADFSTPAIIGGSYKTLATEAYLNVIAYGNVKKAAAISVVLFLPAVLVFLFYSKEFQSLTSSATSIRSQSLPLRRKGLLYRITHVGCWFFIAWILLQYGAIFLSAVTDRYQGDLFFTLQHVRDSRPYVSRTFLRSIVYSLIAGVVGSILGLLLEYYTYLRKIPGMKVIDFIATMPYIVPGTFFGIGYILAFNNPPLELTGTAAIVILNVIFKQLPFASKVSYSTITQISPDTLHSAKDLGGQDLYVLKDVVFPLSKNGLYISFVNSFTSTMTTIGSVIFLVYPTQKLATLVMFDVIQSGKYGIGAVIACMLILICLAVNGLYYGILARQRRGKYVS